MELGHLNVEHWQSSSDQQTILHVARVPLLFVIGVETPLTIGADSLITASNPGAELKFVEHSGAAITVRAARPYSHQHTCLDWRTPLC